MPDFSSARPTGYDKYVNYKTFSIAVGADAPLMEAAYLLVSRHLSHVAVLRDGTLVGMLRPEDLYKEIATPFA